MKNRLKFMKRFTILFVTLAACLQTMAQSNSLYVNNAGNVGVGTASPSTNLTIGNGSPLSGGLGVVLARGSTTNLFEASDNTKDWIGGVDNTLSYAKEGTLSNHDLAIITNNNPKIYIQAAGNVGIGTTNPLAAKLAVIGNISFDASAANQERIIGLQRADGLGWNNTPHMSFKTDGNTNGYLTFSTINSGVAGHPDMVVFNYNGNVGIGTTNPQYALDVPNGQVHAQGFVAPSQTYADFVFKPGYKLPALSTVEASIKKEGHLPGIPSETEAKAHGIDLAQMQVKLLQQVEELTLHVIDQEKRLDNQARRIEQLEKENAALKGNR